MVGRKRKCVVPGCDDMVSTRYHFPTKYADLDVYKIWMERINNSKLFEMTKDQIYRLCMICARHFEDDCKVPGYNKLKRRSLPSLFLPDFLPNVVVEDAHSSAAARVDEYFAAPIDLPSSETDDQDRQVVNGNDLLLKLESFDMQTINIPHSMKPTLADPQIARSATNPVVTKYQSRVTNTRVRQRRTKKDESRREFVLPVNSSKRKGKENKQKNLDPELALKAEKEHFAKTLELKPIVVLTPLETKETTVECNDQNKENDVQAEVEHATAPDLNPVTTLKDESPVVDGNLGNKNTSEALEENEDTSEGSDEKEDMGEAPSQNEDVTEGPEVEGCEECEKEEAEALDLQSERIEVEIVDHNPYDVIQTEEEAAVFEKPYFKSVKSYLLDSACLTEVCRICFSSIVDDNNVKLYGELEHKDAPKIKNMLRFVLPHLDLELYPNTVFCSNCIELLMYSYKLKEMWLTTEEKLHKIVQQKKGMTNRDADLVIVAKAAGSDAEVEFDVWQEHCEASDTQMTDTNEEISAPSEAVVNDDATSQKVDTRVPPYEMSGYRDDLGILQYPKPHVEMKCGPRELFPKWGVGPYMCDTCGLFYHKLPAFRKHVAGHQGVMKKLQAKFKTKAIMCELCGLLLPSPLRLQAHNKKHVKHECPTCHKIFRLNSALQKHMRMHLAENDYTQCHLCGKKLPYKESLRAHMMIHYPKKAHECQICNKKFNTPSQLRKHLRRHTSSRFECEHCGKTTKYEESLKRHIQIYHKNDGEFVCEYCSRPYWKRVDLIKHKIKVHGWGPQRGKFADSADD